MFEEPLLRRVNGTQKAPLTQRYASSSRSLINRFFKLGFIPVLLETVHSATQDTSRANDKATENAVCILRNLSYRLAAEVPDLKDQLEEVMSTDSDFMDCFGNWKKNKKKQNRDHVGFPRFHRVPGQGNLIRYIIML